MTSEKVSAAASPWRALWIGAACGTASGLLGIGGAVIMVPLLVAFLGLGQHKAHGTSLAVSIFTALAALVGYWGGGHVDWRMAALLTAGSVVGAPLGASTAQRFTGAALRRAFGVLMLLVGIRLVLTGLPGYDWIPLGGVAGAVALGLLGLVVGFSSGFFGIGGGVVLVPVLVLLAAVPQHLAQGVSLLFVVPTAIAGSITHARLGNLEKSLVLPLAGASALFALLASHVASALPAETLRVCFGILLGAIGVRLALRPARS